MSAETELIKDRLDIAEIVGEYVQLKKAGHYYKGLCPFHQEKTPSFVVSPDKGIWHCFGGCSEGGDVFSFIQKIEGIDFPAALKMLAERAGVEVIPRRSPATGGGGYGGQERRQKLFDLLELTARFYHELLMNQAVGAKARHYLKERGIKEKTEQVFRLGYAVNKWDGLQIFLRARGYGAEEMVAAGVVGRSAGGKMYDRFRGRIIWPITDLQGRVVALGGRIVPWHETGEEGKYINSPETELYVKGRTVYNLDRAKKSLRTNPLCLVVEGYMDVVMLVQVGIENVVASSGTAFTDDQIAQLKRFTGELHFAFDADTAGFKAAISATEGALRAGMRVATVMLPGGKDPADMAFESPVKLKKYLAQARSLVSILLAKIEESVEGQEKEKYLEELLPMIAGVGNPVHQGELVQEVVETLHIPEARVLELLQQQTDSERNIFKNAREENNGVDEKEKKEELECYLLGLVIVDRTVRRELWKKINDCFMLDDEAKTLYKGLQRLSKDENKFIKMSADELVCKLPKEQLSFGEGLRRISEERLGRSQKQAIVEGRVVMAALQRRHLENRLVELQDELSRSDVDEKKEVLKKFKRVTRELVRVRN